MQKLCIETQIPNNGTKNLLVFILLPIVTSLIANVVNNKYYSLPKDLRNTRQ